MKLTKFIFVILLLLLLIWIIFYTYQRPGEDLPKLSSHLLSDKEIEFISKLLVENDVVQQTHETLQNLTAESVSNRNVIFFIRESPRLVEEDPSIDIKTACALESAALQNPTFDTLLLHSAVELSSSDRLIQSLLGYKNVKMLHTDFASLTNKTTGSDIDTRLSLLRMYRGIYLHYDVISVKPIGELLGNFLVKLPDEQISFDIIGWRNRNNSLERADNVTVNKICVDHQNNLSADENCAEFRILNSVDFYGSFETITNETYTVKVYGEITRLFVKLAETYCPKTFKELQFRDY
ncbi:hypothetical protein RI129_009696 [Pyrocoelia pectoralis]|uniref:Uncharacterized protein n=1 Tax=Pyrocoelia pectoralis TaxID=417401 RepID=A0AAN7VD04_9COLE